MINLSSKAQRNLTGWLLPLGLIVGGISGLIDGWSKTGKRLVKVKRRRDFE